MLLEVSSLHAGYGAIPVLRGVDIHVEAGEVVAVLGSNGVGKTTFNRVVSGLMRPWGGSIRFVKTETGEVQREIECADFLPATPRQGAQWTDFAIAPKAARLVIVGVDKERKGSVEVWDFDGAGAEKSPAPTKDPAKE